MTRKYCRKKICRICWRSWRRRAEVASESPCWDFCCDDVVRGRRREGSSDGRAALEFAERAAELADVQWRLCGAALFDAGPNQFGQFERTGTEVGLSDDGRRKI